MPKVNLKTVDPSTPAPKKRGRPKSVRTATLEGSRLEVLEALARRVAGAIDDPDTPARDLAALARRMADLSKEIEALRQDDDDAGLVSPELMDAEFDAEAI